MHDFNFKKRVNNERIERDTSGNTMKKYGGTPTGWPTHTKVQMYGESHKSQQRNVNNIQNNVTNFMKNNF